MNEPSAAMAELQALNTYLDAVMDALQAGNMPDMRSFEGRVAEVCAALLDPANEAEQTRYREALKDLLARLDDCEQHIRAFKKSHA